MLLPVEGSALPERRLAHAGTTLETYVSHLPESHRTPEVTVAWQGGEPTLMGLDFFVRSVELVDQYRRPGQQVQYTMQTNGVLLDDEWCALLKEHDFLAGLSVDGPHPCTTPTERRLLDLHGPSCPRPLARPHHRRTGRPGRAGRCPPACRRSSCR
jgi:hypothetical protein